MHNVEVQLSDLIISVPPSVAIAVVVALARVVALLLRRYLWIHLRHGSFELEAEVQRPTKPRAAGRKTADRLNIQP